MAVLAHELAHWKRRDHWVRRLEAVVLGLYWWYPVAWWAHRRLEQAEEECCDAWVVWSLPAAASSYAEALVTTATFLSGHRNSLPLGASGAGRTLPLKRRLNMILCDRLACSMASDFRELFSLRRCRLPFLPSPTPAQQAGASPPIAPAAPPPRYQTKVIMSPAAMSQKKAFNEFVLKEIAVDPDKPNLKVRVLQPLVREVERLRYGAGPSRSDTDRRTAPLG